MCGWKEKAKAKQLIDEFRGGGVQSSLFCHAVTSRGHTPNLTLVTPLVTLQFSLALGPVVTRTLFHLATS